MVKESVIESNKGRFVDDGSFTVVLLLLSNIFIAERADRDLNGLDDMICW